MHNGSGIVLAYPTQISHWLQSHHKGEELPLELATGLLLSGDEAPKWDAWWYWMGGASHLNPCSLVLTQVTTWHWIQQEHVTFIVVV